MIKKILNLFFEKKESEGITIISREKREILENGIKKKPLISSGVYSSFEEREKFYKEMFTSYSQR